MRRQIPLPDQSARASRLTLAQAVVHARALLRAERLAEAEAVALALLEAAPEAADALQVLAIIALRLGRLERALALIGRALARQAENPHLLVTLAWVQAARGDLAAQEMAARRALAMAPGLPGARMALAEALLAGGKWGEGLAEYEARFDAEETPRLKLPLTDRYWDCARLEGGTLLLLAEQGIGDAIQFARYIGWARAASGARVELGCPAPLLPVLRQIGCIDRIFTDWPDLPDFTAWAPLSSLPRLHGSTPHRLPPAPPLRADPVRSAAWRAELDAIFPAGLRRIGLAWAGNPEHPNDARRSMPAALLAPLAQCPGIALVAVQKGPAAEQFPTLRGAAPAVSAGPRLDELDATMALLAGLDLVISVDTSIAHLAGALRRPVWTLLAAGADWRWLRDRADTPWYATMRLFRQTTPGDWPGVVAQVVQELRDGTA